jgi:hypothetical protein
VRSATSDLAGRGARNEEAEAELLMESLPWFVKVRGGWGDDDDDDDNDDDREDMI